MKKIYIAGPEVFDKNAKKVGEYLSNLTRQYGFEPLFPLDNEIKEKATSEKIFLNNIEMINKADYIIANLNPWRGKEPDSGTVWECGYAFGKGKKIFSYIKNKVPYIEQFSKEEQKNKIDKEGKIIEDFNLPLNLMLYYSTLVIQGDYKTALKRVSSYELYLNYSN
jgi:nucleoside 2-deoxyribosyltransferase